MNHTRTHGELLDLPTASVTQLSYIPTGSNTSSSSRTVSRVERLRLGWRRGALTAHGRRGRRPSIFKPNREINSLLQFPEMPRSSGIFIKMAVLVLRDLQMAQGCWYCCANGRRGGPS